MSDTNDFNSIYTIDTVKGHASFLPLACGFVCVRFILPSPHPFDSVKEFAPGYWRMIEENLTYRIPRKREWRRIEPDSFGVKAGSESWLILRTVGMVNTKVIGMVITKPNPGRSDKFDS
ncbi:hypothetical protein TNCV_4235681 [Trichonephila clavipes]|nr:hypothetical protein TNCV_4235681 [Trichonephila clavipes]